MVYVCPLQEVTTASNGHGYILANGRTWVREKPPDATVVDKPSVSSHKRAALSVNTTHTTVPQNASPKGPKRARHPNMSLHIIGDKRIYADSSKECLQFAKLGSCPAGIFCSFEHNGSSEHQQKKVCNRYATDKTKADWRCILLETRRFQNAARSLPQRQRIMPGRRARSATSPVSGLRLLLAVYLHRGQVSLRSREAHGRHSAVPELQHRCLPTG